MPDKMTKAAVLAVLYTERSCWEALLAEVGEARMIIPLLTGCWAVKDVIAHSAWYERQTAALLPPGPARHLVRDWRWVSAESRRNADLFTEFRNRPLPEVLADGQAAFAQMLAAVEALTEQDLGDLHRRPNLPPGWQPWHFIADHSYEHYREHMPSIRTWLDRREPDVDTAADRAVVAWAV